MKQFASTFDAVKYLMDYSRTVGKVSHARKMDAVSAAMKLGIDPVRTVSLLTGAEPFERNVRPGKLVYRKLQSPAQRAAQLENLKKARAVKAQNYADRLRKEAEEISPSAGLPKPLSDEQFRKIMGL